MILNSSRKRVFVLCWSRSAPSCLCACPCAHLRWLTPLWLLAHTSLQHSCYVHLLLAKSCLSQVSALNQPHLLGFSFSFHRWGAEVRGRTPQLSALEKKQSKSCLLFPLSSIRVRLIRLLKKCFPEQLQQRACNPRDTASQAAKKAFPTWA